VLDMLDAIGVELAARTKEGAADQEQANACAEDWLERELLAGRRLMGMGHRIYRVRDPRAAVLERALERHATGGGLSRWSSSRLALARTVERAAEGVLARKHPERALKANVEFYTAVLLDAVGLPRTLFSPTFAVARVVGWAAHVAEQRAHGRLIRPASRYVGKMPGARKAR
jgi:citrate synthase